MDRQDDLVAIRDLQVDRRLLAPHGGSDRHVHVAVQVQEQPQRKADERPGLRLALTLDRSGSMSGDKLELAKRAALAVVDWLEPKDQLAVIVFDHNVQLLSPLGPVTPERKSALGMELAAVQPGGSTALHAGWLTDCHTVAPDGRGAESLARCLLLTDGLANVGLTDAEAIAAQAQQVRATGGVSTSTFGVGEDYDESLLGPMAVAGGGQFHHLDAAQTIGTAMLGELGELFAVAMRQVQLEVESESSLAFFECVSEYRCTPRAGEPTTRWTVEVGDLLSGEQRHLTFRLQFGRGQAGDTHVLRFRVRGVGDQGPVTGPWQRLELRFAADEERSREARSADVMHWAGLHHGLRAIRRATALNQDGDFEAAGKLLGTTASRIEFYEGDDAELKEMRARLEHLASAMARHRLSRLHAKEQTFQALRVSRGQRDVRGGWRTLPST